MKKEEIDNLISESLIETDSNNIWEAFLDNINNMESASMEENVNCSEISLIFAAVIITAQVNSINTMREVLYKLCCEDDHTEK